MCNRGIPDSFLHFLNSLSYHDNSDRNIFLCVYVYCSFKTWSITSTTLGYRLVVMVSQTLLYQQFLISIQLSSFAMHPPMTELMFVFTKQQTNKRNLPSQPTRKINRIWQLNPRPASPLLKEGINISLAMGNWLHDTFNNIALVLKPSEFAL